MVDTAFANYAGTIPVSAPQTEVRAGGSVVITPFYLPAGKKLRLRWLQLHVPKLTSPLTDLQRVNPYFDAMFVGLYGGLFDQINLPTGSPLFYVGLDGTGFATTNPRTYVDISVSGHYGLCLVNNTMDQNYEASVTGAFRLW